MDSKAAMLATVSGTSKLTYQIIIHLKAIMEENASAGGEGLTIHSHYIEVS